MRLTRFNLSMLRPVRLLVATCVCALLFFSSAFPAFAANPSDPKRSGEENLLTIEEKAGELARETPLSRKGTQAEANQGLNEIQGSANAENMYRPENSQNNAPSVEGNIKQKLEKAMDKVQGKG